jgi:hypothetical protein
MTAKVPKAASTGMRRIYWDGLKKTGRPPGL